MTTFHLPDLGEGLTEAELVAWHVSAGDHVVSGQPLVSVETDKAVVEIPSPLSGTVAKLHAEVGAVLATGAPLADIETGKGEDTGAVVGKLPGEKPAAAAAGPARPRPQRRVPAGAGRAMPAVRRLARDLGVDLANVRGTGPGGEVVSADVRAEAGAGVAGRPLGGVRRAMAEAMARSGAAVVPATLTDFSDISVWKSKENPTLRLIRAIVRAAAAEPALNAWFDGTRLERRQGVDLALAVDTPEGLFAPVLEGAEGLKPEALAAGVAHLKGAAEARTLKPAELKGGTITLSNFGMLAGIHAALVVSPPQVAILGAGRIHDAVLAVDGVPAVRRVLPLSLSFDHRAVTGGEAARFMAAVLADLQKAR